MAAPGRFIAELRRRHVFRVAAGYAAVSFILVQVADIIVEPLGLPGWTLTLIIILVLLGFPIALVLSWALEWTPEGVQRTRADASPGDLRLRKSVVVAVCLLVVTAAAAGSAWHARRPSTDAVRSIAVLRFVDLSETSDQSYFSDGLAEELVVALSRIAGLQVASRTASFQFVGPGADLAEIGRRLGVRAVLEGSVRRRHDQLRVTVRLVDVSTGFEIWTERYDRRMSDIFAVQEDIAAEILNALQFPRADQQIVRPGTADLIAYDHLLRGNHHLTRRTPVEVLRAIDEYARAAARDPNFALPLFRQAYAYLVYADWGWDHPQLDERELLRRAEQLVDRGRELEPASGEGWLARAYLRVLTDPYRMSGALAAFERALELDGRNAEAWHQYGQTLMTLGRYEDAATAYHRALLTEPQRAMSIVPLAAMALYDGRLDEALQWADSAVALEPANSYARASRARILVAMRDTARGRVEAEAAGLVGDAHAVPVKTTLIAALAATGAARDARRLLDDALRHAGDGPLSVADATFLAMAAAAAAESDIAVGLLDRASPQGAWFWFYLQSPLFDALRPDQRFQQLLATADPRRR